MGCQARESSWPPRATSTAPGYSPDGSRIVFTADRSGSEEIWVTDSEGLNPVQLTHFGGPQTGSPQWSPDGKWIAFDSRPNQNADIFVISAEGGVPRRLTSDPSRENVPSWSRDGRWIYFRSDRSGSWEIWKMPSGGGAANQITRNRGFESMESPDGKFLYYSKGREPGIWRIPTEGGAEERAAEFENVGKWRYWSVTSQGYFYAAMESGPFPSIDFFDSVRRRKTELVKLQRPADLNGSGLAVSPDGKRLLFTQVDQQVRDIMLVRDFR